MILKYLPRESYRKYTHIYGVLYTKGHPFRRALPINIWNYPYLFSHFLNGVLQISSNILNRYPYFLR